MPQSSLLNAEMENQTHPVTLLYFTKIRKSSQDVNTCVTEVLLSSSSKLGCWKVKIHTAALTSPPAKSLHPPLHERWWTSCSSAVPTFPTTAWEHTRITGLLEKWKWSGCYCQERHRLIHFISEGWDLLLASTHWRWSIICLFREKPAWTENLNR